MKKIFGFVNVDCLKIFCINEKQIAYARSTFELSC